MIISAIRYTNSQHQSLPSGVRPYRNDETTFLARVQNVAKSIKDQSLIDLGPTRPKNKITAPNEHVHILRNNLIIGCYGIEFGYAFQLQNSHPLRELRMPLNSNQQIDNIVNRILNALTIDDIRDIVIESAILDTP
jgi:hypothetical protein